MPYCDTGTVQNEHEHGVAAINQYVLEDLRFDKVADPCLGHDGDCDCCHYLFDHEGVGHACHTAVSANVCRNAFQCHHGTRPRLLCNARLHQQIEK